MSGGVGGAPREQWHSFKIWRHSFRELREHSYIPDRGTVIGVAAGVFLFFLFLGNHLVSGLIDLRAYERPGLSF